MVTSKRQRFLTIFLSLLLAIGLSLPPVTPVQATPNTWSFTGSMATMRAWHTATLLPNGKVLVAGGYNNSGALTSAELYDPATGIWSATGNMGVARDHHAATLLPNGKVLVTGGWDDGDPLASAELYDPATGTWSATGSMDDSRALQTATLLLDGKVLVAGGMTSSYGFLGSAELYDPATGTWSATGNMDSARYVHTATLLPNGKVLVAGGDFDIQHTRAELYDPATGTWSVTGDMLGSYICCHTATLLPNGRVLAAGGENPTYLTHAEVYNPATGAWSLANSMGAAREFHVAVLLPNGKVLVAGGYNGNTLALAELYDPAAGTWSATASMGAARRYHSATLLPDGRVLVVGGLSSEYLSSAELYDQAAGVWNATGSLATARSEHTATLLPDGRVLVAGGWANGAFSSAELYDPATSTWSTAASMDTPRCHPTATLLPGGQVLVAGGYSGASYLSSAEVYDPAAGTWSTTGSMSTARYYHTATLLPDGKVLVTGGWDGSASLASAELYDPATGTWSLTGSMAEARYWHTATLLPDGKVLVAGGNEPGAYHSAELYNPTTGTWIVTDEPSIGRVGHTATLLPNGKVLVAGGNWDYSAAELYDPLAAAWSQTGSLSTARHRQTATLLPNGKVLLTGGYNGNHSAVAELYDPGTGTWSTTASMSIARSTHTATLLPDGRLLVAGGFNGNWRSSAELYDTGLNYLPAWRPLLDTVTELLLVGQPLAASGSGWRGYGYAEASSGPANNSATNYPLVQLYRLDNAQMGWLPTSAFSETALTTLPVSGIAPGPALITVFVNGIPSIARFVQVVDTRPQAQNDEYMLDEDTILQVVPPGVLINDNDPLGYPLTAVLDSDPSSGSLDFYSDGSFVYTPSQNFNGLASFTYHANDGWVNSNIATVTLNILPVNDPPQVQDDEYTLDEDTVLQVAAPGVLANDVNVDNDVLTATLLSGPINGELALNLDGSFTYTPAADYNGPDFLTYRVSDGILTDTGIVTLTVNAINDAPLAVSDAYSLTEDTPLVISAPGLLVNDSDGENDPLIAILAQAPLHGSLALDPGGSFTYTPTLDYSGLDTFTYRAFDGQAASTATTVILTITPVNDAPLAASDAYTTAEDTPLFIAAPGVLSNDSDVDDDALAAVLLNGPTDGELAFFAGGDFIFTPTLNFNGSVTFTYSLSDGNLTAQAIVSLTVTPVNDAPLGAADFYTTTIGTPLVVAAPGVLTNDSDIEGQPLMVTLLNGTQHGSLALQADGSFIYLPTPGFRGIDQFTYQASDGQATSALVTVTIQVLSGPMPYRMYIPAVMHAYREQAP